MGLYIQRQRKQKTFVIHGRRKVKAVATSSTYMGNFCGYNVKATSNFSDRVLKVFVGTLFIDSALKYAVDKYKKEETPYNG